MRTQAWRGRLTEVGRVKREAPPEHQVDIDDHEFYDPSGRKTPKPDVDQGELFDPGNE